jgi:hypothetical protein
MITDFAQISSDVDQRPDTAEPVAITMNQNDAISGIEHDAASSPEDIVVNKSGIYVLIAAPQIGRLSGVEPRYVDFWLRRNGTDIPNSNIRAMLQSSNDKDVIVNQTMMPFNREDKINVMMSVEKTGEGLGIEAIRPKGEPIIPSIIFSMHMIKDYDELVELGKTGMDTSRQK